MGDIPMTLRGKLKIEEELKRLKFTERPAVIKAIEEARKHGDLSENAEYQYAREKQSFIEGRIIELEDKLAGAHVIDPTAIQSEKILFGATVEVQDQDTGDTKVYRLVGVHEADIKQGRISIESPIARQLLNKRQGEQVTIRVPKGELCYEIVSVRYVEINYE